MKLFYREKLHLCLLNNEVSHAISQQSGVFGSDCGGRWDGVEVGVSKDRGGCGRGGRVGGLLW